MESQKYDFDSVLMARRQAVEKSLRKISGDELRALGEELFPFADHPWRDAFYQFLEENAGNDFYHGKTADGIQLVYCPAKDRGIWYMSAGGKGPLQARGRKILKEIVEARETTG